MPVPEDEVVAPEPIVPGVTRALSPLVRRILAEDEEKGVNTYLIGIDEIVVIDPGPDAVTHIETIAGCGGDRIRWIASTSDDPAHAGAATELARRTGAELYEPDDGETLLGTEFRITTLTTPGLPVRRVFLLEEERTLFAGALVPSDGAPVADVDSDAYAAALRRFTGKRLRRIAPSHGHLIEDAADAIEAALASTSG